MDLWNFTPCILKLNRTTIRYIPLSIILHPLTVLISEIYTLQTFTVSQYKEHTT